MKFNILFFLWGFIAVCMVDLVGPPPSLLAYELDSINVDYTTLWYPFPADISEKYERAVILLRVCV